MGQQVRISDRLFHFIEGRRRDSERAGETIERLLIDVGAFDPQPLPTKGRARRKAIYRPAILKALAESGGRAQTRDLKPRLIEQLRDFLAPKDFEERMSNRDAWWYHAEYERWEMMPELIAQDSPYGVWELTPKGKLAAAELIAD